MAPTEKELMQRGKPIEDIDHRITDRIDAERDERIEAARGEAAADRPRRERRARARPA